MLPTINFKSRVVLHPLMMFRPEMVSLLLIARTTAPPQYSPTVTSGVEGRHRVDSFHYTGWALDFRTRDLSKEEIKGWVLMLTEKLGEKYYVLLESNHIHIHYKND